jgi:hypothetical protein
MACACGMFFKDALHSFSSSVPHTFTRTNSSCTNYAFQINKKILWTLDNTKISHYTSINIFFFFKCSWLQSSIIHSHWLWLINKRKTFNSLSFTLLPHHSSVYLVLIVFRTYFELMEFSTYSSRSKHLPLLIYSHALWSSSIIFSLFTVCCASIKHIMFKHIHLYVICKKRWASLLFSHLFMPIVFVCMAKKNYRSVCVVAFWWFHHKKKKEKTIKWLKRWSQPLCLHIYSM